MAIAIDSTSNGNTSGSQTSLTVSHTCSGSDRVLMVAVRTLPTGALTGVTYNGVAMTQIANTVSGTSDRTIYLYYLIAPATGTNNIVASFSGSTNGSIVAASYTGVLQTGFPNSQATVTVTSGTSRTLTTSNTAVNGWLVGVSENDTNTLVAGSRTYVRSVNAGTTNFGLIDSNTPVQAGSQSMNVSFSGSTANNAGILVSMSPTTGTLANGCVAYYRLDESSGNAYDSTGNGNTLTNNNTVAYSSAKINNGADGGSSNTNKSLTRDGNTPAGISYSQFASAWTISCWVNTTTNGATKIFTGMQVQSGSSQRRNMYLVNDNGTLKVNVYDGSANTYTTSQSMSTGTWYNVILTYNGSTITVYVNNSSVLSQSRALSAQADAQSGGFGILCERQNGGSFNHLSGIVDEVGVWNRVLTTEERTELYNSGTGKAYGFGVLNAGQTAYWKLDESSGNATDASGSNTLTNNGTSTYSAGKINNGVDFGSSNSSKSLSSAINLGVDGGPISFSAWIKPTALPSSNADPYATSTFTVVATENVNTDTSYLIHLSNVSGTNRVYFSRGRSGTSTVGAYIDHTTSTSTWTHVAGTYDGLNLQVYVNGVAGNATTDSGNGSGSSNFTGIGVRRGPTAYFSGMVDEVGVWTRPLSVAEVTSLYNAGNGKEYPFLSTSYVMSATVMNYTMTMYDVNFTKALRMTASTMSYTISMFDVAFRRGYMMVAETMTYTMTFFDVIFDVSGWRNVAKSVTTWISNVVKPNSTYSNRSKSSSTWSNRPKS